MHGTELHMILSAMKDKHMQQLPIRDDPCPQRCLPGGAYQICPTDMLDLVPCIASGNDMQDERLLV